MTDDLPLPLVDKPAIQVAREFYKKWDNLDKTFPRELANYLEHGMVFVRPDLFLMAKIIDLGGDDPGRIVEPAWYIRMAVGKLSELLRSLPIFTQKICFTRHGSLRLRMYSLPRIAKFVAAQESKEK